MHSIFVRALVSNSHPAGEGLQPHASDGYCWNSRAMRGSRHLTAAHGEGAQREAAVRGILCSGSRWDSSIPFSEPSSPRALSPWQVREEIPACCPYHYIQRKNKQPRGLLPGAQWEPSRPPSSLWLLRDDQKCFVFGGGSEGQVQYIDE